MIITSNLSGNYSSKQQLLIIIFARKVMKKRGVCLLNVTLYNQLDGDIKNEKTYGKFKI